VKKHLKIKQAFVTHWIPLITWLLFIFLISSIHGSKFRLLPFNTIMEVNIEGLLSYRQAIFHIGEYGLLAILMYRVLKLQLNHFNGFIYLLSFVITILYAISDEAHQYFVPGRFATLIDIIFDTIGIILGLCYIYLYSRLVKR